MAKPHLNDHRGFFVGAAILLWMLALMGSLQEDLMTTSRTDTAAMLSSTGGIAVIEPSADVDTRPEGPDEVTELVIKSSRRQPAVPATVVPAAPAEPVPKSTYPVWFESERSLGVCQLDWKGGSKTANLHVTARLPEGTLEFEYQCGKHRGRGSIEVEPEKINGVLLCNQGGRVTVETVRSKEGRCGR